MGERKHHLNANDMKKLTTEFKAKICQEILETKSPSAVAAKYSIDVKLVRRWFKDDRKSYKESKKLSEEDFTKAVQILSDKVPWFKKKKTYSKRELSRIYKIVENSSYSFVCSVFEEALIQNKYPDSLPFITSIQKIHDFKRKQAFRKAVKAEQPTLKVSVG